MGAENGFVALCGSQRPLHADKKLIRYPNPRKAIFPVRSAGGVVEPARSAAYDLPRPDTSSAPSRTAAVTP